jgi:hypothetical protein
VSHGNLTSWVEVSAMASNEKGQWAPFVGALRDASPEGSSGSVSTIGCGTQIPEVEVWAIAKGGCGHQPFGVVDRVVP